MTFEAHVASESVLWKNRATVSTSLRKVLTLLPTNSHSGCSRL